jgi:hypothetical protein
MAMQYLAGSRGYHIASGHEFVLVQDTCADVEKVPINFIDSASCINVEEGLTVPPIWKPMCELRFTQSKTKDFQGS